ncbi:MULTISPECIES: PEP-CTERM sorting domain-containing protein [unclassified Microcystis]|uniref:PEP-CTERM sorting domain-containing protein n=1 Tax=unclassified Microcystis TaxID=2643300 RepID=UPI00257FC1BF|nr:MULTISPECIES: PEP-CTERM sorting domain-containing protein [unclassified Microcystis]
MYGFVVCLWGWVALLLDLAARGAITYYSLFRDYFMSLRPLFVVLATTSTALTTLVAFPQSSFADIKDTVPPGGSIFFCWTEGRYTPGQPVDCHRDYLADFIINPTGQPKPVTFRQPNDRTITDWQQVITDSNGKSKVYGGNIKQQSTWEFQPLLDLPNISWRIPDIAPFNAPDTTIYTEVNLDLYLSSNPNGFLNGNWSIGQTLDELGINIINGQISGVQGIYFATSDFTFDPNSPTGWIPIGGDSAWLNYSSQTPSSITLGIQAEHDGVLIPEPSSTLSLLALGTLGAASTLKRQIKSSKSTEKETTKVG